VGFFPTNHQCTMDVTSSARMAYTAVSLNQKQAEMKGQMAGGRRRKRDKDKCYDEEDGTFDIDALYKFDPADILWKAGLVFASAATIGTNIFTLAAFLNPVHMVAAATASSAATTVAYTEVKRDTSITSK
jgi:hypothetical protein